MSDPAPRSGALRLRLHRDHLYIEAAMFDAHMPQVRSVALVRAAGDLLILPIVTAEAGGFLVKQVNARGDRAIHAADFFRLNTIDETQDIHVEAWPHELIAGFVVQDLFANS